MRTVIDQRGNSSPLWLNEARYFAMFNYKGRELAIHNTPYRTMIDAIWAVRIALGFALALSNWRKPYPVVVLLWFVLAFQAGALTDTQHSAIAHRIQDALPKGASVYLDDALRQSANSDDAGIQPFYLTESVPFTNNQGKNILVIVPVENSTLAEYLRYLYPNLTEETLADEGAIEPFARVISIPQSDIADAYGAEVEYAMTFPDGTIVQETKASYAFEAFWTDDIEKALIDKAMLTGNPISATRTLTCRADLLIQKAGTYTFEPNLSGIPESASEAFRYRLDRTHFVKGCGALKVQLGPGQYLLEFKVSPAVPGVSVEMEWIPPLQKANARISGASISRLSCSPDAGLTGYHYTGINAQGKPYQVRDDPMPEVQPDFPIESSVVWRGTLTPPEAGQYLFSVMANSGADFSIEGKRLTHWPAGADSVGIALDSRPYPIEIRYWKSNGVSNMKFLWTPPNGKRVIVPSQCLRSEPLEW